MNYKQATTIDWLTKCPAHDDNFKSTLKSVDNAAVLEAAIEIVKGMKEKKTVLKALEARLRGLEKARG